MPVQITSPQNQRIKEVLKLNKRSERAAQQRTVVEGFRECLHALDAGLLPLEAYICLQLLDGGNRQVLYQRLHQLEQRSDLRLFEITAEVYAKIAYRGDSGGILLVIPYLTTTLKTLPLSPLPFLAIVEGIEKPGNLGAILRTADAAGVDAVIVCAGATDLHNPNVIRASVGALFTVPVVEAPTAEVVSWLRQHQIAIVAASPEGATLYTSVDYTRPVALVTGSEAFGLSPAWLEQANHRVYIPMRGATDSLNLATSTALLLYEVVRQRTMRPT
jgi:RNA methyltransferase, TrmH family